MKNSPLFRFLPTLAPVLALLLVISAGAACASSEHPASEGAARDSELADPAWQLSEAEWKERLTREEYYILRQAGTERAFTGKYWDHKEDGIYTCAGCGLPLFDSRTKYKSGTGWPSYWQPIDEKNVASKADRSLGMMRTEILCARCGGHLGHVFDDGPQPTGLRYCMNSAALDFVPRGEAEDLLAETAPER